jgi:hypothetical protein
MCASENCRCCGETYFVATSLSYITPAGLNRNYRPFRYCVLFLRRPIATTASLFRHSGVSWLYIYIYICFIYIYSTCRLYKYFILYIYIYIYIYTTSSCPLLCLLCIHYTGSHSVAPLEEMHFCCRRSRHLFLFRWRLIFWSTQK